nr:hypothetical protein [Tanacetum cinerariifolium]
MALPDKHQLKFNIHKDAKYLMEAIEKRFGGNKEIKKVQKTLLKQQYENFSGTSSEILDQIHNRFQKLVSQLEILADLEDQSLDDLFNNLKIYEAEVESSSSTSHNTQNIDFVSSNNTDNTNKSVSVVPSVSAASTKAPVSTLPNMAMLTMRDGRFLQMTGRNLGANGTAAIRFDMSKVECYNCHRRGHFTRECRSPRDNRNKDTPRRTVPVEASTFNALVSHCNGVVSNMLKLDYLFNVEPSTTKPTKDMSQSNRPSAPIIEDWVIDSEDESEGEPMPTQKAPSFVQSFEHVKTPRPSVKPVEHPKQAENLRKDISKSRGRTHSWTRKACFVCKSLNHLIKDCDYYEKLLYME